MVSTRKLQVHGVGKGDHWGQSGYRKTRGVTHDQVIMDIALMGTRFGAKIELDQLASVPADQKELLLLKQVEQEIDKKRGKSLPSALRKLEAKAEVLRTSNNLRIAGGRPPTVYQVLAISAIKFGLDSDELWQAASAMKSLYHKDKSIIPWLGSPIELGTAINQSVTVKIEKRLYEHKDRSMSSAEIAESIGLNLTRNEGLINRSMQLLEVSGYVRKQMVESSTNCNVWAHKAYENPYPRHENVAIHVLRTLYHHGRPKSMLLVELHRPTHPLSGNPKEKYDSRTVGEVLKRLKKAELVETNQVKVQTRIHAHIVEKNHNEVRLTAEGLSLVQDMEENKKLPEPLRKILLGEKQ